MITSKLEAITNMCFNSRMLKANAHARKVFLRDPDDGLPYKLVYGLEKFAR